VRSLIHIQRDLRSFADTHTHCGVWGSRVPCTVNVEEVTCQECIAAMARQVEWTLTCNGRVIDLSKPPEEV